MIYQPHQDPSLRKQRRQAVRRNHADFQNERHWHERPVHTSTGKKLSRFLSQLTRKSTSVLSSAATHVLKGVGAIICPRKLAIGSGLAVATLAAFAPISTIAPPSQTLQYNLHLPSVQESLVGGALSTEDTSLGYVAGINDDLWKVETIQRNETVGDVFSRLNLGAAELHRIVNFSEQTKGLARVFPGQKIAFRQEAGKVTALQFEGDEEHQVLLTLDDQKIEQTLLEHQLEVRTSYASASITHSLFGSGMKAGMSDALTTRLANVFNYDIDFAQDLQPGDSFALVYEQIYRDGEKLRDGDIIAATFINQGKKFEVYRFVDEKGFVDYLSADGRSRKKAFIRTPVEFTRISSVFSPNRKHPVLGKMRRHMGVDYAASTGTPIMATGTATVKFIGVQNGYGNVVILQHPGGIETLYGHMSRFAKGLRRGSKVTQNQVIGYVGMTGLATGPHLHYEFRMKGVHRDPLSVDLPVADPLNGAQMARFKASVQPLIAQLSMLQETLVASRSDSNKR